MSDLQGQAAEYESRLVAVLRPSPIRVVALVWQLPKQSQSLTALERLTDLLSLYSFQTRSGWPRGSRQMSPASLPRRLHLSLPPLPLQITPRITYRIYGAKSRRPIGAYFLG